MRVDRGVSLSRAALLALGLVVACDEAPACASEELVLGERLCRDGSGAVIAISAAEDVITAGRFAGPFTCTEVGCDQHDPPLPGDGEWECKDELGALVCRGGERAAGIVEGPRDPGFACAAREDGPEICVALSPSGPEGMRGHRCTLAHEHGERRRCVRDASGPSLLAACGVCEAPLTCALGRCVPPLRSEQPCWLDADCEGTCVLGRCTR